MREPAVPSSLGVAGRLGAHVIETHKHECVEEKQTHIGWCHLGRGATVRQQTRHSPRRAFPSNISLDGEKMRPMLRINISDRKSGHWASRPLNL